MSQEKNLMLKSIRYNNPGIVDKIIEAFDVCDRSFFVPKMRYEEIYADAPIHIKHGQTISQPSTIARMLRFLELAQGLDVLEIGTNTGYHACLAAFLTWPGTVFTIEIFPDLAQQAKKNIHALINSLKKDKKTTEAKKFSRIKIFSGDALDKKTGIWKHDYDRIFFTASIQKENIRAVKEMAQNLLKENGLLLFPTREVNDYGALELWHLKNKKMELLKKDEGYAFVPLLSGENLK